MNIDIDKINRKHQEIRDLEYFLITIDSSRNVIRGGQRDINAILKVKTENSFSIFGSRWFGTGTHEKEIGIPFALIPELEQLAEGRLDKLKHELNELLQSSLKAS